MESLTFGIDISLAVLALLVQAIIYPTLRSISEDVFPNYHDWYTRRITWFVGPLMIGQVIAHGFRMVTMGSTLDWVAACLVLVAWVATGVRAVPLHAKLARDGQSESTIASLLSANALRTGAWVLTALLWIFR